MGSRQKSRLAAASASATAKNGGGNGTHYALTQEDVRSKPCICDGTKLRPFLCDKVNKTVSSNPVFTPCLVYENQQVVLAVDREDAESYLQNGNPKHAVLIVYKGSTSRYYGACMSPASAFKKGLF